MKIPLKYFAAIGLFALALGQPVAAQVLENLRAEIQELKKGQADLKNDLAVIKKLIESQPRAAAGAAAFKPLEISLKGSPTQGSLAAKVTLVEFTDYQCPFCSRHKNQTSPQIISEYVLPGKVRYVLREFPLANIDSRATKASQGALCAGEVGGEDKYWELHTALFANQKKLSDDDIYGYAEAAGVDMGAFKVCYVADKFAEKIKFDLAEGQKAGIRGTPSFLLGLTDPDNPDKLMATKYIRGAQPFAAFQKEIDAMLNQKEPAKGDD